MRVWKAGWFIYRGLNNYLYYCGVPYYTYSIVGPKNPILII